MKKIVILAIAFLLGWQLQAQKEQPVDKKYPVMKFDTVSYDLGTLHEGDVVTKVYHFKNVGDAPLVISKIRASCGCTVPSGWKKEPIMPGESSEFTVKFNSKHKIHKQHKTITIYCNTQKGTERVSFTANVIPDPEMEKQRAERRKRLQERYKKRNNNKKLLRKPAVKKIPKNTPEYQKAQENLVKKQKELSKAEKKLKKENKKLAKLRKKVSQQQKKYNELRKQKRELDNKIKQLKARL